MEDRERLYAAYERHVGSIYRMCHLLLGSPQDAEDAVQTAFLRFCRQDIQFSGPEHERAWLLVTAKNICRDMKKSAWNRLTTPLDEVPEIEAPEQQEQRALRERLFKLPERYALVLYLYYYEEYSTREIAKMLNRNESTIRTQLQKGRERLKIELEGDLEWQK